MRLTLRTLLAYMDDILDPADQEELGRKIESSAFATELIHRSRDAVRRLRLSAPELLASDSGDVLDGDANLDANTAAEYLDNTLSPEAVAEFERSCLEAGPHADMLLAEAASCHHVLTMVLGEPAEVDVALRQRMYALLEQPAGQQLRIEPAHNAPTLQPPAIAPAAEAPSAPRQPEVDPDEAAVPDYMLAAARARRRTRRLAAAALMGMLIGGGVTWLFWPQGELEMPVEVAAGDVDDLATLEIGQAEPTGGTATTGDAAGEAGEEAPAWSAKDATEAPAFGAPGDTDAAAMTPTLPPLSDPIATIAADGTPPAAAVAAETETTLSENVAPIERPVDGATNAPSADDAAIAAAAAPATDATLIPSIPAPPLVGPALDAPPAAETLADAGAPTTPAVDLTPAPPVIPPQEAPAAAAPAGPLHVGDYLGNNDVLLRFDPASEGWIRLPYRTPLADGDRLLSLPTFRTHVVLDDANAYLSGGTEVNLLPPGAAAGDAPADLSLQIPFGQLVLNAGLKGNRIELDLGGELRVLQLEPSSSMAIEVRRPFEPGASLRREPARAEIAWYLTSGKAQWGAADEMEEAVGPAMWTTAAGEDSPPQTTEEWPKWVDSESITSNERRARDGLAESLVPGVAVDIRLLERTDPNPDGPGRKVEDRALAAKSLAYMGDFTPIVKALADPNQEAAWPGLIESLRQAVARDPASIEGMREALLTQAGEAKAGDLLEMLLGFDRASIGTTQKEMQSGSLVRLIRWWDHEDLIFRVLAWYNINQILGTKDILNYRPKQNTTLRQRAIRQFGERLDRGELPKME